MGGAFFSTAGSSGRDFQELLGLRSSVHPDGSEARVTLLTSQGRVGITIPFEQISAVHAEIRHADLLMLYRQAQVLEQSYNPIDRLLATALRPARVSVFVERNADRLLVQEFRDRSPLVTRMAPEALVDMLRNVVAAAKRAAN